MITDPLKKLMDN